MQTSYRDLTKEQAEALLKALRKEFESFRAKGLQLDMSRGKPCTEQLRLSNAMLRFRDEDSFYDLGDGFDARNYGLLNGVPAMRELFSAFLDVPAENIIVGGNSSLNMMYDFISRAYTHGIYPGVQPWCKLDKVKWLCPSPGYDRHFAITEHFGFELIEIPMLEDGPDMDMVEALVKDDDSVKGMWCIPVYSNPTGVVFSEETVRRLAKMQCAAEDFIIMWDNAYGSHHLYDEPCGTLEPIKACAEAGHPNRVAVFTSTSKMTFAGSGVSCIAASKTLLDAVRSSMSLQTIGYNKINQLMHVAFLKDKSTTVAHMARQAAIIRPKFERMNDILKENLDGLGIAGWMMPRGGYFINFKVPCGTAKRVVDLCAKAGVKLTPAGAAFPYGVDKTDSNIRLAPSYPDIDELEQATYLLALCTKIAALEQLIG